MRENIIKLVTLGLIVLLGLVAYRVFISPKSQGIKNLQQTLQRIERQINTIFGDDVTLRGGTAQNEEILRQLDKFKRQIPSENDLPRVVDEIISQSGKGLDIDYRLIEPQELQTEDKYKRLPLKLSFVSTYPAFISYLTQLAGLSVIVVVDKLGLKRSPAATDKIEIELDLSAFLMPAKPGDGQSAKKLVTAPALLTDPFRVEELSLEAMLRASLVMKKPISQPSLNLQGIWQGKEARAFINGRTLQLGDQINGYQLSQIKGKKAVLTKGGKTYTLTLK
jgi:Tfp pilus assembly protein PilO